MGKELRSIIKNREDITCDRYTEQVLMAADRCDYIEQILKPAIQNNTVVISDRSNIISGMIYGLSGGVSWSQIDVLHEIVLAVKPPKAHLIILTAPYDVIQSRRHHDVVVENGVEKIVKCKIESRAEEFHRKVCENYDSLANCSSTDCNVQHPDTNEELSSYLNKRCFMYTSIKKFLFICKNPNPIYQNLYDTSPSIYKIDASQSQDKVLEDTIKIYDIISGLESCS